MKNITLGLLVAAAVVWREPGPGMETTLRLPANTAYLLPVAEGARFARDGSVAPFAAAGGELAWFGHFRRAGVLHAMLELQVPRGLSTAVRLTVGSTTAAWRATPVEREVTGSDSTLRVDLGSITVPDTGYARLVIALPRGAQPAIRVSALELSGVALDSTHFNLDARRNAASVHLRYATDSTELITGFYNEVQAVEDPVTTYYMATGFARGYFGMQVNSPTERRIIFSVWDAGDGSNAKDRSTVASDDQVQLLAKGDGVVAEVFGNEGTGGHSHLVYDWKTGSRQRFFVTAKPDGTHTIYSGYWFHPERQQWQLIASFRAPKDGKGLRRLYSFSENFGGSTGHLLRKARFGPQWVRLGDGSWRELTQASFTHDPTGKANRLDRAMGVEDGRFYLQHGGFVPGFTASGTMFTRPASQRPPSGLP